MTSLFMYSLGRSSRLLLDWTIVWAPWWKVGLLGRSEFFHIHAWKERTDLKWENFCLHEIHLQMKVLQLILCITYNYIYNFFHQMSWPCSYYQSSWLLKGRKTGWCTLFVTLMGVLRWHRNREAYGVKDWLNTCELSLLTEKCKLELFCIAIPSGATPHFKTTSYTSVMARLIWLKICTYASVCTGVWMVT